MRDIYKIHCSCGGEYKEADPTVTERKEYGCFRDVEGGICCVEAYICRKCSTRITFQLEAPEAW